MSSSISTLSPSTRRPSKRPPSPSECPSLHKMTCLHSDTTFDNILIGDPWLFLTSIDSDESESDDNIMDEIDEKVPEMEVEYKREEEDGEEEEDDDEDEYGMEGDDEASEGDEEEEMEEDEGEEGDNAHQGYGTFSMKSSDVIEMTGEENDDDNLDYDSDATLPMIDPTYDPIAELRKMAEMEGIACG